MARKRITTIVPKVRALLFSMLCLSLGSCSGADGKATVIEILLENISNEASFSTSQGPAVVAFSPTFGVVHQTGLSPLFTLGAPASSGLESLAEDGNFAPLIDELSLAEGVFLTAGVNTAEGVDSLGPLLPGETFRLLVSVQDTAASLSFGTMFVQSNDVIITTPQGGIRLFDDAGTALTGDRTGDLLLLDAGTEVNQEPGTGPDQAPRQGELNQGAAEGGVVRGVDDGFSYPSIPSVLRVTVNVVGEFQS